MRMAIEREIRVENVFNGTIYSVVAGEAECKEDPCLEPWLGRRYRYLYGYVLTKGEEETLQSVDFGYDNIADAISACKAAMLEKLYRVHEQGTVLSLE